MKKRDELSDFRKLLKSEDLQGMIDVARPMLPNPLILTDLTHKLLAISNEEEYSDVHWNEIRTHGGVPLHIAIDPTITDAYKQSQNEGRAVLDEGVVSGSPMLRKALLAQGRVIGYLDSPGGIAPFGEDDIALFEMLGDLCALHMATHMQYGDHPENLLEYFIGDLITGRLIDPYLITERVEHFRWNIPDVMRLVTVREMNEDFNPQTFQKTQQTCEKLDRIFPELTIFVFGRDIKILLPEEKGEKADAGFLVRLRDALKTGDMHGGVSRKFSSMTEFAPRDAETLVALELGNLLQPEERLHFYDGYTLFHMIDALNEYTDVARFCHSDVLTLNEYDSVHNSELAMTLKHYLSAGRNLADAAERLGVHRNTMRHRMRRIRSLLDSDFEDPETAAALLTSFCILRYRAAVPNGAPVESFIHHRDRR
jgi:sugar diacid utilization regulator